ncbi:MAG: 50S ribosomal protein L6 [Planctomycetes bacterium]|nr:50S ribosomal protein L6 [Planctomycetota bacterium]
MSRIGKQPIAIPAGVKVAVGGGMVKVEGPKGKLEITYHPNMKVESDGKAIKVTRPDDDRQNRALHGLTRALINNMVVGVTKGYEKKLKVEGVGFQAAAKGKGVELTVGFANRITHTPDPKTGVTVEVPDPTTIVVKGADKQAVGQFAAEIRASRKPEPYKGKGVRYENEVVRRKEGKSFAAGK